MNAYKRTEQLLREKQSQLEVCASFTRQEPMMTTTMMMRLTPACGLRACSAHHQMVAKLLLTKEVLSADDMIALLGQRPSGLPRQVDSNPEFKVEL